MTGNGDTTSEFEPDTVFERGIGIESIEVGDDTVLFDILRARALRLNASGTEVWRILDERPTYHQLESQFITRNDIKGKPATEAASQALREYLGDLVDHGLIGVSHVSSVATVERKREP